MARALLTALPASASSSGLATSPTCPTPSLWAPWPACPTHQVRAAQSFRQEDRSALLQLLLVAARSWGGLAGARGLDLVDVFLGAVDTEKDPRCLLLAFECVQVRMAAWAALLACTLTLAPATAYYGSPCAMCHALHAALCMPANRRPALHAASASACRRPYASCTTRPAWTQHRCSSRLARWPAGWRTTSLSSSRTRSRPGASGRGRARRRPSRGVTSCGAYMPPWQHRPSWRRASCHCWRRSCLRLTGGCVAGAGAGGGGGGGLGGRVMGCRAVLRGRGVLGAQAARGAPSMGRMSLCCVWCVGGLATPHGRVVAGQGLLGGR